MADKFKLSSSLIVAKPLPDNSYALLLMKRKKGMIFSEAHVFPGGHWETADSMTHWGPVLNLQPDLIPKTPATPELELNSMRIAAIRETFEESGIFIGPKPLGPPVTGDFLKLCREKNSLPELARLKLFSRIITPIGGARQRFDTVFFFTFVPADTEFTLTEESESAAWLTPLQILNLADKGKIILLPPQIFLIMQIAHYSTISELTPMLSTGINLFPIPFIRKHPDDPNTTLVLMYGDELYPTPSFLPPVHGKRHRLYVTKQPGLRSEISPGLVPFMDAAPWQLVKDANGEFRLITKSRL